MWLCTKIIDHTKKNYSLRWFATPYFFLLYKQTVFSLQDFKKHFKICFCKKKLFLFNDNLLPNFLQNLQ